MHKVLSGLRPTALRSCRCAQCASPHTGAMTRKAGTAATSGLRPTLLTSTTLLCSSIFTAAAMVDASAKNQRSQQWDAAISGLEQEIRAVRDNVGSVEGVLVDPSKDWLDLAVESAQWPVNTGASLFEDRLSSLNSVYTPAGSQLPDQWTPKKTAIVNISTRRLELLLLKRLRYQKCTQKQLLELNTSEALLDFLPAEDSTASASSGSGAGLTLEQWLKVSRPMLKSRLEDLELDIRKVWKARWDLQDLAEDPQESRLTDYAARQPSQIMLQELNARLRAIFNATDSNIGSRYLCLALVGHTLATSETAPNLSTYNILLAGLSKLDIRLATNYAINCLRRCNLRPNESTLSIVLQYYTHINDRVGFERWLGFIRGENGGLALANSVDRETDVAENPLLRLKPGSVPSLIELPCPTPMVYSAIIAGKLHFEGMDEAMRTCHQMGREGWGISLDALGPLLRDCARRKDLAAGEQLWQVARQLQSKGRQLHRTRYTQTDERIPQHVYAAMLKLYDAAGSKTQYMSTKEELERVWPESVVTQTVRSPSAEQPAQRLVTKHCNTDQPLVTESAQTDNAHSNMLSDPVPSTSPLSSNAAMTVPPSSTARVDNKFIDEVEDDPTADGALEDLQLQSSSTTSRPITTVRRARDHHMRARLSLQPGMLHAFTGEPSREQQSHYLYAA